MAFFAAAGGGADKGAVRTRVVESACNHRALDAHAIDATSAVVHRTGLALALGGLIAIRALFDAVLLQQIVALVAPDVMAGAGC